MVHQYSAESSMCRGDVAVLHSALQRPDSGGGDAARRRKKPGTSGSQRVLQALLKKHKRKLKALHSALDNQECAATYTDNEWSDGECDFEDNTAFSEDSLSVLRGLVDSPLGNNLPVWVVTDTGNMTRLIEADYAAAMKFERRPLPERAQFSIHGPGGGADRITEAVVLDVRVKMARVFSGNPEDHRDMGEEEERVIRMSFGVCASLPVPILWGGSEMRKYNLLDLHKQKKLSLTLPDGFRYLTRSSSWLVASAEMREAMTRPLRKALGRFAPSKERLANMVKGSREAFNMYTVLYPGRDNVVKVNRRNACIDQGFNMISCTNSTELEKEFGDMLVVIDSVSNGESYIIVRNCTDAALSLPAGRIKVLVTPAISMPAITPSSSEFSMLRNEKKETTSPGEEEFKDLDWSRRDLAVAGDESFNGPEVVGAVGVLTQDDPGDRVVPESWPSGGQREKESPPIGGGGPGAENPGRVETRQLGNQSEGATVVYAGVPDPRKPEALLERPLGKSAGSEPLTMFSWNVNGLGARMDPNRRRDIYRFYSLIKEKNPDVFCLQELQMPNKEGDPTIIGGRIPKNGGRTLHQANWESFAQPFLEEYNVFLSLAATSYAGQAMFVRKSCEQPSMSYNFEGADGHTHDGRLIRAEFNRLVITSLYTPFNGQGKDYQLQRRRRWDAEMLREVTRKDRIGLKHRIFLGDMNVAREDRDMTNDPQFWIGQGDQTVDVCDRGFGGTTANERLRAQHWVEAGDLADPFSPRPGSTTFSFQGKGKFRNKGLRLDGFLVEKTLVKAGGVVESSIVPEGTNREGFMGSDHLPVTLTLRSDWSTREAVLRRNSEQWLDTPAGVNYVKNSENPERATDDDNIAIRQMFHGSKLGPKTRQLEDWEVHQRLCNSTRVTPDEEKGDGTRPDEFPEDLWELVDPLDRPYVQGRWNKIEDPEYRSLCVKRMLDPKGLDIYDTGVSRTKWYEGGEIGEGWSEERQFRAVALANLDCHFPPKPDQTGTAHDVDAEIITVDDRPFKCRPRKLSEVMQAFLTQKTNRMLRSGKLEHSTSSWCHGLVLVPYPDRIDKFMQKHGDRAMTAMFEPEHEEEVAKFFRLCIDLRMLNKKTVPDLFPLPRIDDLLGSVPRGCSRYSISDLDDAFFCARIKEEYRYKTAFRTHDRHLQFAVLPQGWINSPSIFCRLIQRTFEGMDRKCFSAYVDDVLNHTNDFATHLRVQQEIYSRLRKVNLVMKLAKTHMNYPTIKFLGHILTKEGRLADPESVEAIRDWKDPTTTKEVRSFLGATLYYREYIYQYADMAMPLYDLIRKGVIVSEVWNPQVHGMAVQQIKDALTSKPVLMQIDNTRPFRLKVDACRVGRGIGGILEQQNTEGKWQPVSYYSSSLSKTERDYSATELECKALHDCILHYHTYLQYIPHFEVFSDHNALRYMVGTENKTTNGRLMRYLIDLQGYNFTIYYRSGWENCDADAVSRLKRSSDEPVYLSKDELDDSAGVVTPGVLQRARRLDLRNKALEKKAESLLRKLDKKRLIELAQINDRILSEGVENLESDSGRKKFLQNLQESGIDCDDARLDTTLADMNLSPSPTSRVMAGLTQVPSTCESDVESVYDSDEDEDDERDNDPARLVFLSSLACTGVSERHEGASANYLALCSHRTEMSGEWLMDSSTALLNPLLVNMAGHVEDDMETDEHCLDHLGRDVSELEEVRQETRDRGEELAGTCLCSLLPSSIMSLGVKGKKAGKAPSKPTKEQPKGPIGSMSFWDQPRKPPQGEIPEKTARVTSTPDQSRTSHPSKSKGGVVRKLPRTSRRTRRVVDYSEEDKSQPNWRSCKVPPELHPLNGQLESLPLFGKGKVQVRQSMLGAHAGYGLYAMKKFTAHEELCSYEGVEVTPEQLRSGQGKGRDYIASAITDHKTQAMKYIDAEQFYSCYGRFANDPLDDHLVNAKIIWNGSRMVLVAWKDIAPGDEIYISYHPDYWEDKLDKLSPELQERQRPRASDSRRVKFKQEYDVVIFRENSTPISLGKPAAVAARRSELLPPPPDNLATRTRKFEDQVDLQLEYLEAQPARIAEEYAYENLEQSEELAAKLEFLNGRKIMVAGRLYSIFQLRYEEDMGEIIAFRKPLSGSYVKGDEHAYPVYGHEGLYELSERYLIAHPEEREGAEWPTDNVAWGKAQESDPELAALQGEILATGREEMMKKGFKYRLVPSDDSQVKMLVRVIMDRRRGEVEQSLVPKHLVKLTLRVHHEGFAHIGSNRMLETIKLRYFWSCMERDIASHCDSCMNCKLRKAYQRRPRVPIMKYSKIRRPLDRVHIDLTGPLPRTNGGYRYILVMKDYLTKYVWLVPIKTKGALEVAEAFVRYFICEAGIPDTVVSDRGNEFVNSILRNVSRILGINRISTTPYMPRSDGFVENHNKTMKDQLFNYCDTLKQDDWNIFLPTVQLQYNTTVSLATGYTPYMLMHGRECKMPSFSHMKSEAGDLKPTVLNNEYVRGMVAAISDYNRHAVEQTEKNKERFNLRVKQPLVFEEYKPGQQFMLVRRPISEFNSPDAEEAWKISMKLLERYEGPYTIIRMINPVLYDADINGKETRVHAVNMKPF